VLVFYFVKIEKSNMTPSFLTTDSFLTQRFSCKKYCAPTDEGRYRVWGYKNMGDSGLLPIFSTSGAISNSTRGAKYW
jgi:hypothetical protein